MAISLYDASVPGYLQILEAVAGFLDKGRTWCGEHGVDPEAIVETRVAEDMFPFRFQIQSVAFHSAGAVAALLSGRLEFPGRGARHDYAGLQAVVAEAIANLKAVDPDALNAREASTVLFEPPGARLEFTAPDFLFTFAQPNFHFHAATAYGILRARGVPLGKRDFMGRLKLKESAA
jgi:hypothetical protein